MANDTRMHPYNVSISSVHSHRFPVHLHTPVLNHRNGINSCFDQESRKLWIITWRLPANPHLAPGPFGLPDDMRNLGPNRLFAVNQPRQLSESRSTPSVSCPRFDPIENQKVRHNSLARITFDRSHRSCALAVLAPRRSPLSAITSPSPRPPSDRTGSSPLLREP